MFVLRSYHVCWVYDDFFLLFIFSSLMMWVFVFIIDVEKGEINTQVIYYPCGLKFDSFIRNRLFIHLLCDVERFCLRLICIVRVLWFSVFSSFLSYFLLFLLLLSLSSILIIGMWNFFLCFFNLFLSYFQDMIRFLFDFLFVLCF